jgi:uncharacterized protein (DUF952 family)
MSVTILHFCSRLDWQAAVAAGEYSADTLATEGFIHCSTAELVHVPANLLARGRTDLVLLEIDETRLAEPPRDEPGDPSDPASPVFPHIYAPIPVAAVVRVHDFPPGADGSFTVPDTVARPSQGAG